MKSVAVKMFNREYTVEFPNTGQFLDIQVLKSKLTEERYSSFISLQRDGMVATVICDAIATFTVMIGKKLRDELNTESLLSLPLEQIFELAYAFKDQYSPFYEEIMAAISNPKKDAEKEPEKDAVNTNTALA